MEVERDTVEEAGRESFAAPLVTDLGMIVSALFREGDFLEGVCGF